MYNFKAIEMSKNYTFFVWCFIFKKIGTFGKPIYFSTRLFSSKNLFSKK